MKQLTWFHHGLRRAQVRRFRARRSNPGLRAELHAIAEHHHALVDR